MHWLPKIRTVDNLICDEDGEIETRMIEVTWGSFLFAFTFGRDFR